MVARVLGPKAPDSVHASEKLERCVAQHLPKADRATVAIVAAIAGLLATVAYADRRVTAEEERKLEAELGRLQGLPPAGVRAIHEALRDHIVELSSSGVPRYARALREHGDRDLRLQVLELLMDVAAADGAVSLPEVNVLRQLAHSLGLTQDDYNAAQARHRDKLSFLR
jgi:uncharacterized tellurite resistance protein B-like protein